MFMEIPWFFIALGAGAVLFIIFFISVTLRKVVPTNMVHIVQSGKKTISYGTGKEAGNVYYQWPSWVPRLGVSVIKLPVSNFNLSLKDYEAYDKDKVPFRIDVTSFFRISDTTKAAQRVVNTDGLNAQLIQIVQGAVRKVLASDFIEAIMTERSKFGDEFTEEVSAQLAEWGVESVKSMELMDIRDAQGSNVIENIMAKKISFIEMESRVEVAKNNQTAESAEIESKKIIAVKQQEADLEVGQKTAETEKQVGIAKEKSQQQVLVEKKTTQTNDMEVKKVEIVKKAEIDKEEQIILAGQKKEVAILESEGNLQAKKNEAEGIKVNGQANAEAEKLMQLALIEANIQLAKEIGENEGYQQYLAVMESLKAYVSVGTEQAKALQSADVKLIANSGDAGSGLKSVLDIFSSKGGLSIGAMLESLANTDQGKAILESFMNKKTGEKKEAGEK